MEGFKEKLKVFVNNATAIIEEKYLEKRKWNIIIPNQLAINEEECIIKINKNVYNYSDIIECELIEDGNSIIKASLLGTAAKGATFGLAGYLTSAKKETKYCNKLELKITLNDFKMPCVFFKYITKKTKKNSKDYEIAFEKAQKCLSIFKIVIERKNN